MATLPEQPWTPFEKNALLAEIIKAANLPPEILFNVVRSQNLQPRWEDIPLPPGRSLNSCRFAFEELRRAFALQPVTLAPMPPHTPTPLSAPVSLKRPFQYEGSSYSGGATGREIRPKPVASSAYSQSSPAEPPPPKKKRGRPTKAEQLAKAHAAATAGGPERARDVPATTLPSAQGSPALAQLATAPVIHETKPTLPSTTRMPIAAMLTPTVRDPQSGSHSSSSSSNTRRIRSAKSEPGEAAAREEWPCRRRAEPGDSPAQTAILRHQRESSALDPQPRSAQPLSNPPGNSPESRQ